MAFKETAKSKQRGFRIQLRSLETGPSSLLNKFKFASGLSFNLDLIMIDESTVTQGYKLIDDVWNDFMENYKLMLAFVEDTANSSLFTQLLNKKNVVPSDDESEPLPQYLKQAIISAEDKEKARLISLSSPSKISKFGLPKPPIFLLKHTFFDEIKDSWPLTCNVWYLPSTKELKIQTYDLQTGTQNILFITPKDATDNKSALISTKNLESHLDILKKEVKTYIEKWGILETDFDNKSKTLVFTKGFIIGKKQAKKRKQSYSSESDNETKDSSLYDISWGIN
jgi:hypothetical protein